MKVAGRPILLPASPAFDPSGRRIRCLRPRSIDTGMPMTRRRTWPTSGTMPAMFREGTGGVPNHRQSTGRKLPDALAESNDVHPTFTLTDVGHRARNPSAPYTSANVRMSENWRGSKQDTGSLPGWTECSGRMLDLAFPAEPTFHPPFYLCIEPDRRYDAPRLQRFPPTPSLPNAMAISNGMRVVLRSLRSDLIAALKEDPRCREIRDLGRRKGILGGDTDGS